MLDGAFSHAIHIRRQGVTPLTVSAHLQAAVFAIVGSRTHRTLVVVIVVYLDSAFNQRAIFANRLGHITFEGRCIIGAIDRHIDRLLCAISRFNNEGVIEVATYIQTLNSRISIVDFILPVA